MESNSKKIGLINKKKKTNTYIPDVKPKNPYTWLSVCLRTFSRISLLCEKAALKRGRTEISVRSIWSKKKRSKKASKEDTEKAKKSGLTPWFLFLIHRVNLHVFT